MSNDKKKKLEFLVQKVVRTLNICDISDSSVTAAVQELLGSHKEYTVQPLEQFRSSVASVLLNIVTNRSSDGKPKAAVSSLNQMLANRALQSKSKRQIPIDSTSDLDSEIHTPRSSIGLELRQPPSTEQDVQSSGMKLSSTSHDTNSKKRRLQKNENFDKEIDLKINNEVSVHLKLINNYLSMLYLSTGCRKGTKTQI